MLKDIVWNFRNKFRRWVRERTVPMTVEEAEEKQQFWAKLYAGTGMAFLIFTNYMMTRNVKKSSGSSKELLNESHSVSENNKPATVTEVNSNKSQGLKKVGETNCTEEEIQKLQKSSKEKILENNANKITS